MADPESKRDKKPEEGTSVPALSGQSLVFIHPDGAGLAGWNIFRIHDHGPDGFSNWDRLPRIAVYRSHMRDNLDASSHGGGTIHAYGVKVLKDSYGMNGKEPLVSASGFPGSVMQEAQAAGMRIGIVNSGHLAEPGTGCMLASVESRGLTREIAAQLVASRADLIFGGGEVLFLPKGKKGVHGKPGLREDGRNLVEEAKKAGYRVIYRKSDLAKISAKDEKLLGLFAAEDTYHATTEEELEFAGLPSYLASAPTVGEMTDAALSWFRQRDRSFFLMIEEEGTDNFSNATNAPGMLEAFRRADAAIGAARRHVAETGDLTLLVAADSEAGCPELVSLGMLGDRPKGKLRRLPGSTPTGSPLDGVNGTGSQPFVSAPDRIGQRHVFGIAWGEASDHPGSVLARAEGPRADLLPANLDNTGVFRFIRAVVFAE